MKSLTSTMWPWAQYTYFLNYISCYWHLSLNKCGWNIVNIGHIALFLYGNTEATLVHISVKLQCIPDMLLPHVYQKQICLSSCTFMVYITRGIDGGCMCTYVPHAKSLTSTMLQLQRVHLTNRPNQPKTEAMQIYLIKHSQQLWTSRIYVDTFQM